jgi:hypothetical protein
MKHGKSMLFRAMLMYSLMSDGPFNDKKCDDNRKIIEFDKEVIAKDIKNNFKFSKKQRKKLGLK